MESFRQTTFGENALKNQLAQAGFFYSNNSDIKCFKCNYELDTSEISLNLDVIKLHKDKQPDCQFITSLTSSSNTRSKKFLSYDSLRYEKERLNTFIEWPIPWISPHNLAADGYYYLRTEDNCACVFCRGIIGMWDDSDTPRGEHQKHCPYCPFIRGQPVGNVPMAQCIILDKLRLDGEECPIPQSRCETRLMSGSYAECSEYCSNSVVTFLLAES